MDTCRSGLGSQSGIRLSMFNILRVRINNDIIYSLRPRKYFVMMNSGILLL